MVDEVLIMQWTGGSALASKATTWGLGTAIGAGVLAFFLVAWTLLSPAPQTATAHASDRASASIETSVGEYAERYVITWLQSTDQSHAALAEFVSLPAAAQLPSTPFVVTSPAVSNLVPGRSHIWTVTVAATVAGTDKAGKATAPARRYYQVAVQSPSHDAFVALSLPAPVPGPSAATAPAVDYGLQLDSADPMFDSVQQFLEALLSGRGDITRYLRPGTHIAAISPAPFAAVQVVDLRGVDDGTTTENPSDGARMRVLATASLANGPTQQTTAQYALTLRARAGRWEVVSIDDAPRLHAASPQTSATPSPSSTPSPLEGGSATPDSEE